MPTGKYTAADVAPQQMGKYSGADVAAPAGQAAFYDPNDTSSGAFGGLKDLAIGVARSIPHTIAGVGDMERNLINKLPPGAAQTAGKYALSAVDPLSTLASNPTVNAVMHKAGTPSNDDQDKGLTLGNFGQFAIPGAQEEAAATAGMRMLPEAPALGSFIGRTAAAVPANAALNKAQGGSAGVGALMGGGGALLAEGSRALAPRLAESAMNIKPVDRLRGKDPGDAILTETKGVNPQTVYNSAQQRISDLTDQKAAVVDAAGQRPYVQPKGLLQAPQYEIQLGTPNARISNRGGLFDARIADEDPLEPRSGNPMADISEYPGVNPHYLTGTATPFNLSGRVAQPKGTLLTRDPNVASANGITIPPSNPTIPYNPVDLGPAREAANRSISRAQLENVDAQTEGLKSLGGVVAQRGDTPIPQFVSPSEAVALQRGIGKFLPQGSWNPATANYLAGTRNQMYGALSQEIEKAVPEVAPLNQRISSLIPVVNRGEALTRAGGATEDIMHRFQAHTGALTGIATGAVAGHASNGLIGAVGGAGLGAAIPAIMAAPTTKMIMARSLYSPIGRQILPTVLRGSPTLFPSADQQ